MKKVGKFLGYFVMRVNETLNLKVLGRLAYWLITRSS